MSPHVAYGRTDWNDLRAEAKRRTRERWKADHRRGLKRCIACERYVELRKFDRDESYSDGYRSVCTPCRIQPRVK